jgi:hypothetical protein
MTESDGHGSIQLLVCEECGSESPPDAIGWRACLLADQNGQLGELAMFCPECASREFGD